MRYLWVSTISKQNHAFVALLQGGIPLHLLKWCNFPYRDGLDLLKTLVCLKVKNKPKSPSQKHMVVQHGTAGLFDCLILFVAPNFWRPRLFRFPQGRTPSWHLQMPGASKYPWLLFRGIKLEASSFGTPVQDRIVYHLAIGRGARKHHRMPMIRV